jgi:transcriptional regulator with XRE-family HTH domain
MKPGMTDAAFLSQLKRLRVEQGLTQAELAKRARCSEVMISRYENQGAQPSVRTMDRLKSALGFLASGEGKDGGALRSIRHSFHLRPGVSVSFALPEDLTPGEADRLARFIKSLPF